MIKWKEIEKDKWSFYIFNCIISREISFEIYKDKNDNYCLESRYQCGNCYSSSLIFEKFYTNIEDAKNKAEEIYKILEI